MISPASAGFASASWMETALVSMIARRNAQALAGRGHNHVHEDIPMNVIMHDKQPVAGRGHAHAIGRPLQRGEGILARLTLS